MQRIHVHHAPHALPESLRTRLPLRLVDAVTRCDAPGIEEIRLHTDRYASVSCGHRNYSTGIVLSSAEMEEILCRMCNNSLYAFRESINQGFLSLESGIRVGIVGTASVEQGKIVSITNVSGLIIRLPHAIHVNVQPLIELLNSPTEGKGLLLYAPPGGGKTTVLRALARTASDTSNRRRTVVVDTRGELCGTLEDRSLSLDLLVGYPKNIGIEIAVRALGAQLILCDEIGDAAEARAVLMAANCGVPLVATVHASSPEELLRRPFVRLLHHSSVFGAYVGIRRCAAETVDYSILTCNSYDSYARRDGVR